MCACCEPAARNASNSKPPVCQRPRLPRRNDDVRRQLFPNGGPPPATPTSRPAGAAVDFPRFASVFAKKGAAVEGAGNCVGYAAKDASGVLAPFKFERRAVGPKDVSITITHAGICHSDLHQAKSEWGPSIYPMVPGHEIVGIVVEIGAQVGWGRTAGGAFRVGAEQRASAR